MQDKAFVNLFDSEMFEWTQRPCSPELCSSPFKTQVMINQLKQQLPHHNYGSCFLIYVY